jgi:probable phosphoglycerate mutase
MTPLLAIRHGPTEWNAAGRIQGRTDLGLSADARQRLRGCRLPPGWSDATCLSSPLRRAMETAALLGFAPAPDPRLIEMAWGEWEGRRLADLRAGLGAAMAENEARGLDFRPPGGESPREVQERLRPLLQSLSGPTIAVTHKGVLRALYALATGWTMADKPPDKLRDRRAHLFSIASDGAIRVVELNISLEPAP